MTIDFTYRLARDKDLKAIKNFLRKCELPNDDISSEMLENFIISHKNNKIIATVGLEICGNNALLRSLAVSPDFRRQNVGAAMTKLAEDIAYRKRIQALFLLTTTAEQFFTKIGYEIMDRNQVPDQIKATTEFSSICPASAVCMTKMVMG